MSGLTTSESNNIYSPPGNSLAVFLDKNGALQLKDINGKTLPLSNYISGGGGVTPTLPSVFVGYLTSLEGNENLLFENFNLTVAEGTLPILFLSGQARRGQQAPMRRYLWKLGAGEFNPVGATDLDSKIELIQESFATADDIEEIITSPNAELTELGIINEDFIAYMNVNGPYVFDDVVKTYIVSFTKDSIDYTYIFQGTLGTYGAGELQFVADDFIFIYQSTNAGEIVNSTYIRITRSEAETLQATASFIPGATYVITDADINLYGGTEITLTSVSSSQLSLQGSGMFYCPKYDVTEEDNGYGIWSTYMVGLFQNILGTFTPGETVTAQNGATATYLAEGFLNYISGDWSMATEIGGASGTCEVNNFVSPSYAVGQIVHWGGKSWRNINGNVSTAPNKYFLNTEEWELIPFNAVDYNVYIDEIQYDFDNDMIIYRKDRYNNVVSGSNQVFVEFEDPDGEGYGNPIKDFQWGCAQDNFNTTDYFYIGIQGNQVIDSYMETLNSLARYIWFNQLTKMSVFYSNIFEKTSFVYSNNLSGQSLINTNILITGASIFLNTLSNNSSIYSNVLRNDGNIYSNSLKSNGSIYSNNLSNAGIYGNILNSYSYVYSNTINLGGIYFNELNSNSSLFFNILSNNATIQKNNLLNDSNIYSNNLDNSYIFNNILSSSSIYANDLSASVSIAYSSFLSGSSINGNTFSDNILISNNILSSSSSLKGITLETSKTIKNCNASNNSNLNFANCPSTIENCLFNAFNTSDATLDLLTSTILGQNFSKELYDNQANVPRLQYVNNSDVIVITDVNA